MATEKQSGYFDWLKCSNCCDETTQVDKQEIINNNNNPENTVGKNSNLNLYANILNSEQDNTNNYNSGNILNYFNNNRANNNIGRNDECIEIEKNKKNPLEKNINFSLSLSRPNTVFIYNNENDEMEELNYNNDFAFDEQYNICIKFYDAEDDSKTARFIMNIYPENNTWHYSFKNMKNNAFESCNMEEKHAATLDKIKNNACKQTGTNKKNPDVTEINKEDCEKIEDIIIEIFNELYEEQAAAANNNMNNNTPTYNIEENDLENVSESKSKKNNNENNIDKNSNINNNINENDIKNNNIDKNSNNNINENNIDKNSNINNNINENTSNIEENNEGEELIYNPFTIEPPFNIGVKLYSKRDKNKTARFIMNIYPENNTWHYSIRDAKTNKLVSSHDMEEKHAKTLDAIKKNACKQTEANKTNLNVIEINEEGCDEISYIINEIFNKLCEEQAAAANNNMNNNVPKNNIKESYSEDFIESQSEENLLD